LRQNGLKQVLLQAVDEGLSSLGDSPKQAIFFHLESSFGIKKSNIPSNLREFAEALEEIFGLGASYLEQLIIRRFYDKLGLEFEEVENWNLSEYVDSVRRRRAQSQER